MRLVEVIRIIEQYFYLALIGVIALGIIFSIGYFIVYKKMLDGKRILTKKQFVIGGLFIGYIIMVIGVTLLGRASYSLGQMNLHFLSTYREAWNSFSTRDWQFIILNIFMFVPLGILLPLLGHNFYKIKWTIGAGLLFTVSIESLQLITGRGSFLLDDIFNNLLGAIIGYGVIMGLITLLKVRKSRKALVNFLPLLSVFILFGGIFTYYHLQEFGNLSVAYSHRINLKNATIKINIELNDERKLYPIYQAPTHTKESAERFVIDFLKNIGIESRDLEVIAYQNSAIYRKGFTSGSKTYSMQVNYLDGSYSFTDFSSFDDGIKPENIDKENLIEMLKKFGIEVPQIAVYNKLDVGRYQWTVKEDTLANQLIEGNLFVAYYNDNTIKEIRNNLVEISRVKDVLIKSEKEAYEELLEGKFRSYYGDRIQTIDIHKIEIDYLLDSKGFYQPVYLFESIIDGMNTTIFIPALL